MTELKGISRSVVLRFAWNQTERREKTRESAAEPGSRSVPSLARAPEPEKNWRAFPLSAETVDGQHPGSSELITDLVPGPSCISLPMHLSTYVPTQWHKNVQTNYALQYRHTVSINTCSYRH